MTKRTWLLLFVLFGLILYFLYCVVFLSDFFDSPTVKISENYSRNVGKVVMIVTIKIPYWDNMTKKITETGTSFLVNKKQRKMLTNWHLVAITENFFEQIQYEYNLSDIISTKYKFIDYKGVEHNAKPLKRVNRPRDLAEMIVSIKEDAIDDFYEAEIDDSGTSREAEEIIVIGHPFGLNRSISNGIISSLNPRVPNVFGYIKNDYIQITAELNRGSSGSPVVLVRNGKVIGVVNSISNDAGKTAYATPIYYWSRVGWAKK